MIRRRMRLGCLTVAAAAVFARGAPAQERPPLTGVWIGIGVGGGIGSPSCSLCVDDQTVAGVSGNLSAGWIVSNRLRLLLNVTGWRGTFRGITEHYGFALGTAEFYPLLRAPIFVRAGIGLGRTRTALKREPDGGTDNVTGLGPGWELGLGHDFRVGSSLVATASLSYFATIPTEIKFDGVGSGIDVRHSLFRGGVELRWFWSDYD